MLCNPVTTWHEACVVILQAQAGQQTERANTAEAEVARLQQAVQTKSSEGRGWQQELQQAHLDLHAAQVSLTQLLCLSLCTSPHLALLLAHFNLESVGLRQMVSEPSQIAVFWSATKSGVANNMRTSYSQTHACRETGLTIFVPLFLCIQAIDLGFWCVWSNYRVASNSIGLNPMLLLSCQATVHA